MLAAAAVPLRERLLRASCSHTAGLPGRMMGLAAGWFITALPLAPEALPPLLHWWQSISTQHNTTLHSHTACTTCSLVAYHIPGVPLLAVDPLDLAQHHAALTQIMHDMLIDACLCISSASGTLCQGLLDAAKAAALARRFYCHC